jgi:hypothetical protein
MLILVTSFYCSRTTLQMFIACRGLPVLVGFLEPDYANYRYCDQGHRFEHAIGLEGAPTKKVWKSLLHVTKGEGYLQMGDYISAENARGQACAVHPESVPLHLFHGMSKALDLVLSG